MVTVPAKMYADFKARVVEKALKESVIKEKKLRSCNAVVFETENYYILRSYSTVVALIDKENFAGFDFLRIVYGYTATSAQHISKFFHDYHAIIEYRFCY